MSDTIAQPGLTVIVECGDAQPQRFHFSHSFRIGRHSECSLQIKDDVVSRYHAEVFYQDHQWWIKDLGSANGLWLDGQRLSTVALTEGIRIHLGIQGPGLVFSILQHPRTEIRTTTGLRRTLEQQTLQGAHGAPLEANTDPSTPKKDLEHYKAHYFQGDSDQAVGEHTIMVRKAYAEVKKKQRWMYLTIIAMVTGLTIVAGGIAWMKHRQVMEQQQLAADIFYTIRSLEIDLVKLKAEAEELKSQAIQEQIEQAKAKKNELEKSYDRYMDSLDVYRAGLSEKERIILKMARRFGECEINMPDGFVDEVNRYIEKWRAANGLTRIVQRANDMGYTPKIVAEMEAHDLPAQFFYLGLQESHLDHEAIGPRTRFGIAKGMWQFIPSTAKRYGLKTGPHAKERLVDPDDERHDFEKSTRAAAKYLRDIYTTDAQASGLLVMASYNYGERRVVSLLRTMPDNPRERNFWALISKYRAKIPDQTYDYVFSIFAAAVIGEKPIAFRI